MKSVPVTQKKFAEVRHLLRAGFRGMRRRTRSRDRPSHHHHLPGLSEITRGQAVELHSGGNRFASVVFADPVESVISGLQVIIKETADFPAQHIVGWTTPDGFLQ